MRYASLKDLSEESEIFECYNKDISFFSLSLSRQRTGSYGLAVFFFSIFDKIPLNNVETWPELYRS